MRSITHDEDGDTFTMTTLNASQAAQIGARLDRLPMTWMHKLILLAMGLGYFFELGDLNAFSFASPGIVSDWHIPVSAVALATSTVFAGMFVGAAGGGWFADRYGRKRSLILLTLLYAVSSLGAAASWNIETIAVARFFTGIGIGGIAVAATVYIAEVFPDAVRGKYTALAFTIGVFGIPITAAVARVVEPLASWGWRLVFVWGAVGLVDAILISRLEESPRWLAVHGHFERACRGVERLEAIALRQHGALPPVQAAELSPIASADGELRKEPYRRLFAREYRGLTVLFAFLWIMQTCGLYGFTAWVPVLLLKQGISLPHTLTYATLMTAASPLGALAAMALCERFERKWLAVVTAILLAIFAVSYGAAAQPALLVTFGFLVSFLLQFFAVILYTYTPEHFPTSIRSSGMGFSYGVGRLANVIGPFIVSTIYMGFGHMSVFIYIAACWFAVAVIGALFGPVSLRRHRNAQAQPPSVEGHRRPETHAI
jgi:putative MFS transporter